MKHFAIAGFFLVSIANVSAAQQPPTSLPANLPPPAQAAQVLQNAVAAQPGLADVIRARLSSSGMTPDQIRARLQAAGYSPTLLDAYLSPAAPGAAPLTPGLQEAAAVQALGLPPVSVSVQSLPVDTGLVSAAQATSQSTVPSNVFGVDVFNRSTTQFLPLLSGPVPDDYQIGPGDQLVLILTGDVEQTYDLSVSREGFILIPSVGQIPVANLTMTQLRDVLYTKLGRFYSGVRRGANATTQFYVTVANVRAVQVYVVGEVNQPGAYQVSALGTVLSALYAAGGVTAHANVRNIVVNRVAKPPVNFDLYDYLLRGDTHTDIRLLDGDVIFVGLHGPRVAVRGDVLRPAVYELTGNETLASVIADAGGLAADAATERITVERIVPPAQRTASGPQRVLINVPLPRDPAAGRHGTITIPPLPLVDGDLVTVDTLTAARRNFVEINGNVYQPGEYALEPHMTISRLVAEAGGFKPGTFVDRAEIDRLDVIDSTRTLIPVALPADSTAPWPDDVQLADYDVVTIFSRADMRADITVSIDGMVTSPGPYHWREGMTLRDLLLLAHGPKIGADLRLAEVARLPLDRSQGQLATTIRVPLDSTYLFDRDSAGKYLGPPGLPFPASGTPEVVLQPYDNVLIMRQPDFELQRTADLEGEVIHPGNYSLTNKGERLADLIDRAGGLTPRAYPEGIRFTRTLGGAGRIDIDLPRALRERDSRDNIILQPGDTIIIPEFQPSVRVSGAVNSPGSVLWRQGRSLGYYLDAAGGPARLSIASAASVRQANGTVQTRHRFLVFWHHDPTPGPGSEITVPPRDPTDKTDYVALVSSLAQILASSVAILVVLSKAGI